MKRNMSYGMRVALLVCLAALGLAGCVVHARPAVVYEAYAAPAQVYYSGHWLHYRGDGYYVQHGGSWVVAPAVPLWVSSYHRPALVRRSVYSHHSHHSYRHSAAPHSGYSHRRVSGYSRRR